MTSCDNVLDNVFIEPEQHMPKKMPASYRKRYQLLEYNDVTKLSDVMETTVPVHGKGNFPNLEVTPSELVQMVRDGLSKEGIRVPNVRLNGSAATHVLSEDGKHTYMDLDLIFAVDLSEHTDACSCGVDLNNNNTTAGNHRARKGVGSSTAKKQANQRRLSAHTKNLPRPRSAPVTPDDISRSSSPSHQSPDDEDSLAGELPPCGAKSQAAIGPASHPGSPHTDLDKTITGVEFSAEDVDFEDAIDKDSGYTSSESSSVSSLSASPAGWSIRSRTHSLDSSSSVTSSSSRVDALRHKVNATTDGHLDVHSSKGQRKHKERLHHESCTSKEDCWQKIKDVVMTILRELLPAGVSRTRMTDAVLSDAYVQKMVKINNDVDRWSLISLNNNAGRNLELKFVEHMRRQYEFSVDSFQIILDSYQRFKVVSRCLESGNSITISPFFYPSVLAESVYGDFAAALRHLRHRRICTHRPEEIRGGGLLRYCNLLVRDFVPGEVEGDVKAGSSPRKSDFSNHSEALLSEDLPHCTVPSSANRAASVTSPSYSSSRGEDVRRLEQLMCSRFFIDFSEFPRQQQKLLSYLESHFACEENLKFEYLLIVRRVVDKNTVCLMSEERTMIIDFITTLARETLAKNVGTSLPHPFRHPQAAFKGGNNDSVESQFQMYDSVPAYPTACPVGPYHMENPYSAPSLNGNNNCNNAAYYPQYPATVQQNYAPPALYPPPTPPQFYPQACYVPQAYDRSFPPQITVYPPPPPVALCPCCRTVYPQSPNQGVSQGDSYHPSANLTHHVMSVDSAPFFPAPKCQIPQGANGGNVVSRPTTTQTVYLSENSKLFYSPAQHAGNARDASTFPTSGKDTGNPVSLPNARTETVVPAESGKSVPT